MAELILNVKPHNTRRFGKKYGWDQWSSWAWNWPENQIKKKIKNARDEETEARIDPQIFILRKCLFASVLKPR